MINYKDLLPAPDNIIEYIGSFEPHGADVAWRVMGKVLSGKQKWDANTAAEIYVSLYDAMEDKELRAAHNLVRPGINTGYWGKDYFSFFVLDDRYTVVAIPNGSYKQVMFKTAFKI